MHKDKKFNVLKYFDLLRLFVAIGIALLITTGIVFLVSENPAKALSTLLMGPISSKRYLFNVFEMMVPLILTGLSLSLVFKSGNFSMITDASFYMGAVIASFIAIMIPLPGGVHPIAARIFFRTCRYQISSQFFGKSFFVSSCLTREHILQISSS